jgi:hypothetical protein
MNTMSLKVISIKEETKAQFETVQRALSFKANSNLSQDDVMQKLLNFWSDHGGNKA